MRSPDCRKNWNLLVDLAEGRSAPEAASHAATCPDCGRRLAELRRILELSAVATFDAPGESIAKAKAIFAPAKPVVMARLAAFGAGARSAAVDASQLRWEIDGVAVRLMIRPEAEGFRIFGQISGSSASEVTGGDQVVPIVDGVFELLVSDLDEDLWLEEGERLIRIPLRIEE